MTCMGEMQSPAKKAKITIEQGRSVDEVIHNLGGYDSGCYEFSGQKVLVRNNRNFPKIPNKSGEWKGIKSFLKDLFDEEEYQIFLGWLSDAVKCNYNNGARVAIMNPSQMMNIVGDQNAGKTAFTKLIIKPLFGGRMVNGSGLFKEGDDIFNTMETGAEVVVIDDKSCLKSTDANRDHQGETIKSLLVSGTMEIHGKGVNKIAAKPYTRIIRILNPNMINTLPKVNEPSVGEKVIIIKGHARGEAKSTQWFDKMEKIVMREIPYFFRYLVREHETPEEYQIPEDQGRRFPVISYHNAEILAEINESSTSAQLQELIGQGNLESNAEREGINYYEGTSMEIYNELRANLRGDELDRFKRMFGSPDKLLKALRELRIIGNNDGYQKVFYSDSDDITPKFINDGHKYWRVQLSDQVKKESKVQRLFGKKKSKKKFKFGK